MANAVNYSNSTPAAPAGSTNVTFQVDSSTTPNVSAYVPSQVSADWSAVSGVAQILNKPTIPAAQVNSDWSAVSGLAQILNKPTTFGASGASHSTGFVPDPGASAGATKFLREDSTWATPAGGAVTTVFGRTGDVVAVATDYPAFVASGASHAPGMVPDTPSTTGTTKFLREDATWTVAAQLTGTNTWTNGQTYSQNITANLGIIGKMFSTNCRTVVTATDTATVNTDHTLILNGVTTETLPASPQNGHKFYLVNIGGSAATVSGNGHNIWVAGVSAATLSVAPNASIILQYDTTNTIWRQISAPLTASATQSGILSSTDWTTFNNKQAAIGAWTDYTPTVTAGGSMTVTGVTVTDAQYVTMGPLTHFKLQFTCTLGGTASNTVFATIPPVTGSGQQSLINCAFVQGTNFQTCFGNKNTATQFAISPIGSSAVFTLGSIQFWASGFYRTA